MNPRPSKPWGDASTYQRIQGQTRSILAAVSGRAFAQLVLIGIASLGWTPAANAQSDADAIMSQIMNSSLEENLAMALERNPDIQTAQAALAMAQAEFNRTRMRVILEVTSLYTNRKNLDLLASRTRRQVEAGVITRHDILPIETQLSEAESKLRYAVGVDNRAALAAPSSSNSNRRLFKEIPRPQFPEGVSDEIARKMNMVIGIDFSEAQLRNILAYLAETIDINFSVDVEVPEDKLDIQITNESLRSVLLALADRDENLCFVFRDYGIFVTTRRRAMGINAATIPPDVGLLAPAGSD